jgi:hypothetical protein
MSQVKVCRTCGEEFTWRPGSPGYVDQCKECAEDVPLLKAEVSWENKHTPIVRVTDAHTADVFNAKMKRSGVLCKALSDSAMHKAFCERKGERKNDQGARGWYRGK